MKNYINNALFLSATAIVCSVAMPVYAQQNGAYTSSTTTHYVNPDTGMTDDGGTQNVAIGEGMCRSIIDTTALVEVENGKTYATIRVHLYGNMPTVDFKVQGTKGNPDSYYSVSHEVMQEDFYDDFADLRFEIPTTDTLIQCTAYVTPMGREVCFYFDISSGLTAYSGNDFIVSVASEPEPVVEEVVAEVEPEPVVEEVVAEVEPEPVVEEVVAEVEPEPIVEEVEEIIEEVEEVIEETEEIEDSEELIEDEEELEEIEDFVELEEVEELLEQDGEPMEGIEPRTMSLGDSYEDAEELEKIEEIEEIEELEEVEEMQEVKQASSSLVPIILIAIMGVAGIFLTKGNKGKK